MRDVCVVGLGLIGGSVLRAAARAGRTVWGTAESTVDSAAAASDGFEVLGLDAALARAADRDALVVLAVPLTALDEVARAVGKHAPHCLVTDVVSVAGPVRTAMRRHVPEATHVGGHPMTGTAESGWPAGSAGLFADAAWVVCLDDDTELSAWAEVAALAIELGARVVPVTSAEHDEAVARISHLPHLMAAVLASTGALGGPLALSLAAGSFTDGTRVAGTRPELVRAMCEGNREALLGVLDEALGRLGAARGSLASTGGLAATIEAGHQGARELAAARGARPTEIRVDLAAPDARDGLLAIGRSGGYLTATDGDTAIARTP